MTRLLIIEDDKDFADILKECLEEDDDLEITGIIGDEESAMTFIKSGGLTGIHCVLADLQLPKTKSETRVSSSAGLRILEEIRHGAEFLRNYHYNDQLKVPRRWAASTRSGVRWLPLQTCACRRYTKHVRRTKIGHQRQRDDSLE